MIIIHNLLHIMMALYIEDLHTASVLGFGLTPISLPGIVTMLISHIIYLWVQTTWLFIITGIPKETH